MSNLSVQLFRGLRTSKVKKPLGIHWSSEQSPQGASLFVSPEEGEKHTIVKGKVSRGSISTGYDKDFAQRHQILDSGWPEYEETVLPGSKVKVTGVTRVRKRGGKVKSRNIKFNPPRNMTA